MATARGQHDAAHNLVTEATEPIKRTIDDTDDYDAPEGGWGWLVVIAMALSKATFWGILPSFSIIYEDILQSSPGLEGTSVTTTMAAFNVSLAITNALCPALYQCGLSLRQVGVSGGIIYFTGSLVCIFIKSVAHLVGFFGIVQGLGFGMMLGSSLASFNLHFRRRRTMAMAMAQGLTGVSALALPLLAQFLLATFGPPAARAAVAVLALVAAISQLALRKPPSPAPKSTCAEDVIMDPSGNSTQTKQIEEWRNLLGTDRNEAEMLKNQTMTELINKQDTKENQHKRRWRGLVSRTWLRFWRLTGVDVALLRSPRLMAVFCAVGVIHISDCAVFALLPLYLGAVAMSEEQVARTVAAGCGGDIVARVVLVFVGHLLGERNRLSFAAAVTVSICALVALSSVSGHLVILILVVILGLCKGVLYVTIFMAVAEVVSPNKFPAAVSITSVSIMLFAFILNPIIGLVRDLTSSFPACFWFIAVIMLSCPVSWGLPLLLRTVRCQRSPAVELAISHGCAECEETDKRR